MRDRDGFLRVVIVRHQDDFARGEDFFGLRVDDVLFHRHGLVAEFDRPHAHFDGHAPLDGFFVGDVDVREDDADVHEGLSLFEQVQAPEVLDASLLEKGDELGVVEMTLRVEVAVADFDGMVEAEL